MLSKADRLIEQQITPYFSRLSAITKIGLLMWSPSANMNEDEEADIDDLASEDDEMHQSPCFQIKGG